MADLKVLVCLTFRFLLGKTAAETHCSRKLLRMQPWVKHKYTS